MFRFANPQYLYLLLIIPALIGFYVLMLRHTKLRERRYGSPELMHALAPERSIIRPAVKFGMMLLALTLCILMIARPQYGTAKGTENRKGIEAIFVIDVSQSMMAEDVKPNRLGRARLLISTLIDRMQNDKVGLAVFAGKAFSQVPITNDYVCAKLFLDNLSTDMVELQGTNIKAAINLASKSFTQEKGVGKAIIIITDGENHEEGAIEAARKAAEDGRKVFVLGVGSSAGGTIPTANGPLLDDEGNIVNTTLNVDMCKRVADAGNGAYIHVDGSNLAQDVLRDELAKLQQSDSTIEFTDTAAEQFPTLGILLLIILLLELFTMDKQNKFFSRFKIFSK